MNPKRRLPRGIVPALVATLLVAGPTRSAFAGGAGAAGALTEWATYFANANTTAGQGVVHIVYPLVPASLSDPAEEVCAMIYVFDTTQAMQECCGCPVSSDGLLTLNINTDLTASGVAASAGGLTDGVIRLLSTGFSYTTSPSLGFARQYPGVPVYYGITPGVGNPNGSDGIGCDPATGVCCDPTAGDERVLTLRPWASHVHNTSLTEEEFVGIASDIASSDAANLPVICAALGQLGSGAGSCTCGFGS
jgi:hypothetical protein